MSDNSIIPGEFVPEFKNNKVPPLLDISLNVTRLVIVLTTVAVMLYSILAKVSIVDLITRVAVTIIVMGGIGWLFNWMLSKFLIEATLAELKEKAEEEENEDESETADLFNTQA